jgi:hypothetical protein
VGSAGGQRPGHGVDSGGGARQRIGWCQGADEWTRSTPLDRIDVAGRDVSGGQDGQVNLVAGGAARGAGVGGSRHAGALGGVVQWESRRWGRAAGCAQEGGGAREFSPVVGDDVGMPTRV